MPEIYDPYRQRREKAASIRERRMGAVDFSLPVDGDVPSARSPSVSAGSLLDGILADLVRDRSPFFDEVSEKWAMLFPDLSAKPGKWVDGGGSTKAGKLFLHVRSAAASFALRPRLPAIKKKLATLASAPSRFSLHVEIVGSSKSS